MSIETIAALATGISAIVVVLVYIYNRGRREGALTEIVKQLRGVVPDMIDVQKDLSRACQQISDHACDLNKGSLRMDEIDEDIDNIMERLMRIETKLDLPPLSRK